MLEGANMILEIGLPIELGSGELHIVKEDLGTTFLTESNTIYPKELIKKMYCKYGNNLISKGVPYGGK